MKNQMGAFGSLIPTDFPSLGAPWLLSGLASLYGRSGLADRLRIVNVAISNVPGAQVPLYLAGAKMLDYYPVSIAAHGVALNITVQSYMGQLCFGLIACRRAVPDVREITARRSSGRWRCCASSWRPSLPAPVADAQAPAAVAAAAAAEAAIAGPVGRSAPAPLRARSRRRRAAPPRPRSAAPPAAKRKSRNGAASRAAP